ncbi:hypothetical protein FSP39_008913 [Pinctada imbricata]|uniref:Protein kinase domain-containing protein n=1 Tax=Pinctada imbricata TaxID=66713 RepID=A0AA88YX29_PINIB|nr:hypothetical protein FSP39_008913 [Pinctada imbricata]
MLRHKTMIVDTPGIGESTQMTDKLLQYLPKAVAFIYVINSANAGGVQSDRVSIHTDKLLQYLPKAVEFIYVINSANAGGVQSDRLLRIFERQKKWEQDGMMQEFDPSCTIFVCNKWDQVPLEEEKRERRRILSGLPYTENFRKLLDGIERLIPASLLAKVRRHANWLEIFLGRLHHRLIARINATKKNREEKLKMKAEVQERIEKLRYNTDEVKSKLTRSAELKCEDIAQRLHVHLNLETTKNRMFMWQEVAEIPEGSDLEVIKYRAKKLIVDSINMQIVEWCRREDIAMVTNDLFDLFKKECKLLEGNCQDLDRVIEGVMSPLQGYLEGEETSSDSDLRFSNKVFPIQEKLALVLSAPLWLPLVISAGVIALPVAVGLIVKEALEEKKKLTHFKENKMSQMMRWAEEVLENFTQDFIFQVLKTDYLKSFCEQLEDVCENIIPKQIKADEQLMSNIIEDMRDSETIKKQYQPLEKQCRQVIGELLILKMEYFDGYSIPKEKIQVGNVLGRGNYSEVRTVDFVNNDGEMVSGAIKTMRTSLNRGDSYDQMTEVKHLKNLNHENIVKCYGVCFQKDDFGNKFLCILMEICEETLENLVICPKAMDKSDPCDCHVTRKLPCCHHNTRDTKAFKESWDFFYSMTVGMFKGLEFVHKIGYVHRDLKLSNVLVKNNVAKIADVGFAKEKALLTGSVIGTPTHMAPEVLQAKLYDSSADIYSMSIALWEMWYAKKVFSEDYNSEVVRSFMSLHDHIVNGHRPDFNARYAPPKSLQILIKECWEDNPKERPMARQLVQKMAEINTDIIIMMK